MGRKEREADLIAVKMMQEQDWVYSCWSLHLTINQMSQLSARPESEGGLGKALGPHAIKSRLDGYRERMRDALEVDVEAERSRIDQGYEQRMQGYRLIVTDPNAPHAVRLAAMTGMREEDRERRKLLGLDRPAELKVDVASHDAVTEELNAMLARAGRPPIENQPR